MAITAQVCEQVAAALSAFLSRPTSVATLDGHKRPVGAAEAVRLDAHRSIFVRDKGKERRKILSLESFFIETLFPNLRRQFNSFSVLDLELSAVALACYLGPRGWRSGTALPAPVVVCEDLFALLCEHIPEKASQSEQLAKAVEIALAFGCGRWRSQQVQDTDSAGYLSAPSDLQGLPTAGIVPFCAHSESPASPDPNGWGNLWPGALQEMAFVAHNISKRKLKLLASRVRCFEFEVDDEAAAQELASSMLDILFEFINPAAPEGRPSLHSWEPQRGSIYHWFSLAILNTGSSGPNQRQDVIKVNFAVKGLLFQKLERDGRLVSDEAAYQCCLVCGMEAEYAGGRCSCGSQLTVIRTKPLLLNPTIYGTKRAFYGCRGLSFTGTVRRTADECRKLIVGAEVDSSGTWKEFFVLSNSKLLLEDTQTASLPTLAVGRKIFLRYAIVNGRNIAYAVTDFWCQNSQRPEGEADRDEWDHYFEWGCSVLGSGLRPTHCQCGCTDISRRGSAFSVRLIYSGTRLDSPDNERGSNDPEDYGY